MIHRLIFAQALAFARALAFALVLAGHLWLSPMGLSAAQAAPALQIQTLDGTTHMFRVTVAKTPAEQAQGLMHVSDMAARTGMLFPMQPPRRARFWMRNTLIPLDMIFILPGGRIEQVVTRRDIKSDVSSASYGKVSAVLELNAGEAKALQIGIGDLVTMNGVRF
jgi:uncharacterized membrane protein (UPF0127 family)